MHDLAGVIAAVRVDGKQRDTRCPAHADSRASLSIGTGTDRRVLLYCHAGCSTSDVLSAAGLKMADLTHAENSHTAKPRIVATYDYTDEAGVLLYQVCRMQPKDFRQRRPDGSGRWIWKLGNVRRVLYRLPKLQGETSVFIVEGEKDVLKLVEIGLVATTNAGGASKSTSKSKWRPEYTEQLKVAGVKKLVILPDNDAPGRAHAEQVAQSCQAAGLDSKIVVLPDLPAKADISDWIDAGHTRAELEVLVESSSSTSPAKTSIDLVVLLDDLETFIRRYVVLTDDQAAAVTLWAAHTHTINAFDCTPYLQITSATAEAGKTRLLEVLECLVAKPWLTQRTSAAVLVRKIDGDGSTLLLDESDAAFNGDREYAEALRGLLNAGYRRSGKASLCIGQGANITYRDFATFSPKAIAGIGNLPDTVASRSIRIELKRRTKDEVVAKFRERDARREGQPIVGRVAEWATAAIDLLRTSRPDMPLGLRDRAEDVWEPLLAIADLAGEVWPNRTRRAAVALMGTTADDDINIELLRDIGKAFEAADVVWLATTAELIPRLTAMEERPWAHWRKGDKPITSDALARRLKGFGVVPVSNGTARGYRRASFEDAWRRYLPISPSTRQTANDSGADSAFRARQQESTADETKTPKSPTKTDQSDGLTGQQPDSEEDAADGLF